MKRPVLIVTDAFDGAIINSSHKFVLLFRLEGSLRRQHIKHHCAHLPNSQRLVQTQELWAVACHRMTGSSDDEHIAHTLCLIHAAGAPFPS